MVKKILTILLLAFSLNLLAQDKPKVKKLPVKIVMTKVDINKETGVRNEESKEEYTLEYNSSRQLICSVLDYYSYGKKTISARYEYNKHGNLLNEESIRESGEKWYSTFRYEKYKGLDFVIVRTSYGDNFSTDNEEAYPFDFDTGMFISDKVLGGSNYKEYNYDADNNLISYFYNASTMSYSKTEEFEYGTVYSPYLFVNKLPFWYSSSLLLPDILLVGEHFPIKFTETIRQDYEEDKDSHSVTTFTITSDEDNYPVKVVENRDLDLSDKYLFYKEYTFTYDVIKE